MGSYDDLLKTLEFKLKSFVINHQQLQFENKQLKQELEEKTKEIGILQNQQKDFEERLKLTQIAKTIEKKQDITEIKREINELVRGIDKSISWLNKVENDE